MRSILDFEFNLKTLKRGYVTAWGSHNSDHLASKARTRYAVLTGMGSACAESLSCAKQEDNHESTTRKSTALIRAFLLGHKLPTLNTSKNDRHDTKNTK